MSDAPYAERTVVRVGLLDVQHDALEHLGPLAVALDDADMHPDGVAWADGGQIGPALQLQQVGKLRHEETARRGIAREYSRRALSDPSPSSLRSPASPRRR